MNPHEKNNDAPERAPSPSSAVPSMAPPSPEELTRMLFVLGAQDPEMREIEKVLTLHGIEFVHAAVGGQRCFSGNAYEADSVVKVGRGGFAKAAILAPHRPAAFVECLAANANVLARIDHHNPGDAGFEMGPSDYMRGSSLGQTLTLLGAAPTEDQRMLAAADHCLTAAYAGLCPGVDPHDLLFMRAAWQGLMTRRTMGETMVSILDAARAAKARFDESIGASVFPDPTRMPRDLPEGAAYAGVAVVYRGLTPAGSLKEMIKGADAAGIEAFMERHRQQGRKTYGNPHRGYAGAYL